ncbi:MAG: glycoside hydrolase family 3 C-terminal domain-containing protein [Alphaproteobacteria bacterium]|nr:glycoside hydrolase family 3 C-terminal domain-containing protein [Alphaproteobacteria bacterium]MBU1514424.1 glycoside hydrolase family 3 C-terminal domain-containing protein [Alphaproteobacteria bacterium]MBU2097095.1 glycoside hydrolase family 3 C-terminal domain-containing protein [Alphaproteobacteria bacterium]MBU2153574.1 glycoside hydrolase family 3 C-terminal domain-containing protein [Alphaproteobacteria bacterium]MBU2308623.1 glycoside hydrolase family 3 C-terminal domain-containin
MSKADAGDLDARTDDVLARLTRDEKVRLLAGASSFALHGVERLGVPSLNMTDGPTGVRSIKGQPATVFPVGVAIAATWNPQTAKDVAAAIGREAHALGDQVVLAPTINIMRIPTWGRNFESYSEDPYLAGIMGTAYVQGLQSEGVGASLKHYAANNQELERFRVDARVDERTLREIYLAAFERVIREADPWTVMASYNKLNGTYASEHRRLLTEILKNEWGYDGMVVSDWTAVKSTAPSANAGMDLEMPGPPRWFGDKLMATVEAGEVSPAQIDDNARRVLRLILRSGLMDGPRPAGELRTPRHRVIAFDAACEAMTLLKNDGGLLPLSRDLKRVAVIGPNAVRCMLQGGGSSQVVTDAGRSIAEGVRALLGAAVTVVEAQGADNDAVPPPADRSQFSPTDARDAEGLKAEYFAGPELGGEPTSVSVERHLVRWISGAMAAAKRPPYGSFRWTGWFWPEASGVYEFSLRATGTAHLTLDSAPLIGPDAEAKPDRLDVMGNLVPRRLATMTLEGGRGYPIQLDYVPAAPDQDYVAVAVRPPAEPMSRALAAASDADAVILVLGSGAATEAEGYDRPDMDLPGRQDELARAVLAANRNTVVVMNTGSPFAMPWIDQAKAVLQMWLPGEAGPNALAAVLLGQRAPGGRLPVTFPKAFGDHPAHAASADPTICEYAEGLGVGYRWFDDAPVRPLFPFGHGLAYTTFEISDLATPATTGTGDPVHIAVSVTNTGDRDGQEVVQVYVAALDAAVPRPPKELKTFAKVALTPGETTRVSLELEPNAFAYWDVDTGAWRVDPGAYDVLVGRSAGDIRVKATVRLT